MSHDFHRFFPRGGRFEIRHTVHWLCVTVTRGFYLPFQLNMDFISVYSRVVERDVSGGVISWIGYVRVRITFMKDGENGDG